MAEEQADDAQALNETLTAGSGLAHAPRPSTSAFRGGVEFANVNKIACLQYFRQGRGLLMDGLALSAPSSKGIFTAILRSGHEVLMISTRQCSATA